MLGATAQHEVSCRYTTILQRWGRVKTLILLFIGFKNTEAATNIPNKFPGTSTPAAAAAAAAVSCCCFCYLLLLLLFCLSLLLLVFCRLLLLAVVAVPMCLAATFPAAAVVVAAAAVAAAAAAEDLVEGELSPPHCVKFEGREQIAVFFRGTYKQLTQVRICRTAAAAAAAPFLLLLLSMLLLPSACHLLASHCILFCFSVSPLLISLHLSVSLDVCLYLPLSLSVSLPVSLPVSLSVSLSLSLSLSLSICLSVSLPVCLPVSLPPCLSLCLSVSLPVCLPISLSVIFEAVPGILSNPKCTFYPNLAVFSTLGALRASPDGGPAGLAPPTEGAPQSLSEETMGDLRLLIENNVVSTRWSSVSLLSLFVALLRAPSAA